MEVIARNTDLEKDVVKLFGKRDDDQRKTPEVTNNGIFVNNNVIDISQGIMQMPAANQLPPSQPVVQQKPLLGVKNWGSDPQTWKTLATCPHCNTPLSFNCSDANDKGIFTCGVCGGPFFLELDLKAAEATIRKSNWWERLMNATRVANRIMVCVRCGHESNASFCPHCKQKMTEVPR